MVCWLLGWIGGKPVEYPFVEVGQLCSTFYFLYFLVISPIIIDLEHFFWENNLYLSRFVDLNKFKEKNLYLSYMIFKYNK